MSSAGAVSLRGLGEREVDVDSCGDAEGRTITIKHSITDRDMVDQ